jgi:hypothetical protein
MSRDQFKAWLALAVDGITYGAHFKEASRDRTAKTSQANANKKYSAMLSVWSTMAALQPYVPYTGAARSTKTTSNTYYAADSRYSDWGYPDTSRATSVTTSSGTTRFDDDDDDYRTDDFYDRLFSDGDSARYIDEWDDSDEPSWRTDLVHDSETDEWYNYAGMPVSAPKNTHGATVTDKAQSTTKPTVSNKGWTTAKPAPKRDLSFSASSRWFSLHDLALHLSEGRALDALSDDDVESMDTEVWVAWASVAGTYGIDTVLTEEQIAEICGANVLADLREGNNE